MAKINVITPNNLGKGIKHNPQSKKWEVNVDNSTITVNPQGQLVAQSSGGLDCEAIDRLPIKPWKKDTTVLAKQDGQCIRLKPNGDIFTDIVVDLVSSKQNLEIAKGQSETVNLIAMVTNAGVNPTGEVFITLTKPQLGTYQLGTPTTNNIGETKTGELTWKVPSMASGKALVITLPVTLSAVGSFSFGLQATSTIDTDVTNNSKTFTFAVTAKNDGTNTNYVPTGKDCPLIIATDLTHNQRLNVYTTGTDENFNQFGKYINVFADGRGFAGKQIKLEGASTVVVSSENTSRLRSTQGYTYFNSTYSSLPYGSQYGKSSYSSSSNIIDYYVDSSSSYSASQELVIASAGFVHGKEFKDTSINAPLYIKNMGTFDPETQIFTFNSDLKLPTRTSEYYNTPYNCVIWCRPAGKDCKWQGIPIVLGIKDRINFPQRYTFTKVKGNVQDEFSNQIASDQIIDSNFIKMANFVGGTKPDDLIATKHGLNSSLNEIAANHTVTVISGQEAQFTIRATGNTNNLHTYISSGKTHTSYDASTKTLTVTVAANATPTDSIYWDDLKIIVK